MSISRGVALQLDVNISQVFSQHILFFIRWRSYSTNMSRLLLLLILCQLGRIILSWIWFLRSIFWSVCNSCQKKTPPGTEDKQRFPSWKVRRQKNLRCSLLDVLSHCWIFCLVSLYCTIIASYKYRKNTKNVYWQRTIWTPWTTIFFFRNFRGSQHLRPKTRKGQLIRRGKDKSLLKVVFLLKIFQFL